MKSVAAYLNYAIYCFDVIAFMFFYYVIDLVSISKYLFCQGVIAIGITRKLYWIYKTVVSSGNH